jgi:ribosome-binding protein aMBF1 (putative translation factor)
MTRLTTVGRGSRGLTSYDDVLVVLTGLRADVVAGRRREGLSQRALAELTGVSVMVINRFERAEGDVQLGTVLRLLAWLAGRPIELELNGEPCL